MTPEFNLISVQTLNLLNIKYHLSIVYNDLENVRKLAQTHIMEARASQSYISLQLNSNPAHIASGYSDDLKPLQSVNPFYLSPKGKIYMDVGCAGEGFFKSARKILLISEHQCNTDKLHKFLKIHSIFKNLSIEENLPDINNEKKINLFLWNKSKECKKQNLKCLSKVHISKPITIQKYFAFESDYAEGGDLQKWLEKAIEEQNPIPFSIRMHICKQMAEAVQQLHHLNILHRDIKPDNFLINNLKKFEIQINDFGKATFLDEKERYYAQKFYRQIVPPEFFHDTQKSFDFSFDIYQLGVTFYLIFTHQLIQNLPIFKTGEELIHYKCNPERWEKMELLKETAIYQLLLKMVDKDPQNRPSIEFIKFILDRNFS